MVKFFRIADRGSYKSPTITAVVVFLCMAIATMALLPTQIIITLIIWIFEYFACVVIFSAPVRVAISKIMHWTREPFIYFEPRQDEYDRWCNKNAELFKRCGLKLYKGD